MTIKAGAIYRHFKTRELVRVVGITKDSETLEKRVVYMHLKGDPELWDRPLRMWDEQVVSPDGVTRARFTLEEGA